MFLMQQALNDETNGAGWEDGYTKNGKLINWKRCIYMECAELIDSFAWKHWKNISAAPDVNNIVIEIVDIWHFVMSYILEQYYGSKDIDHIVSDVTAVSGFAEFSSYAYDVREYSIYEIVNDIELIIHETSGFELQIGELLTDFFRVGKHFDGKSLCAQRCGGFLIEERILCIEAENFRVDIACAA